MLEGGPPQFLLSELTRLRQLGASTLDRLRTRLSANSDAMRLLLHILPLPRETLPTCTALTPCLPSLPCRCVSTPFANAGPMSRQDFNSSSSQSNSPATSTACSVLPPSSLPTLNAQAPQERARKRPPPADIIPTCKACEAEKKPPARGRKPKHTCNRISGDSGPQRSKKECNDFVRAIPPSLCVSGSPILPGLANLGNTCYLNACLSVLPVLDTLHGLVFRSATFHKCDLRRSACFLCTLNNFHRAYISNEWKPSHPLLQQLLDCWHNQFRRYLAGVQHDAHDAWTSLIAFAFDSAREHDRKEKKNKQKLEFELNEYRRSCFLSFVRNLRCSCDSTPFVISEYIPELVLPPPETPNLSLQDMINAAVLPQSETVEHMCSKCGQTTPHRSITTLTLSPYQQLLAVHFKKTPAFFASPFSLSRIENFTFPSTTASFRLIAGIMHYGVSANSGHFCSFRRTSTNSWLYTNDEQAYFVSLSQIEAALPNVLFFTRSTLPS